MSEKPSITGEAKPGGCREVFNVAWPLIVSTGSFTVMQFVDRIFLAHFSGDSIQAALPAGILSFTMICGFMALAGYANTFVAQYHGAGDPHGCARSVAQALWFSLFSWPVLAALIPLGRFILRQSGHPAAVLAQELDFFTILLSGGVAVVLNAAVSSFFTGRGETFTNMIAVVAGNLVNIALDYVLIFGHLGFPALGIRGAAIATVIAGFVTPAILLALYFNRRNAAEFGTRAHLKLEPGLFRRLLRFGFPSGMHLLLDISSFTAFVLLTGKLGKEALAVSNISLSVNMVAFMPMLGIGIAASIVVGQYQGRRDAATAAKAGWSAVRLALFYVAAVGATFVLFPRGYLSMFAGDGPGQLRLEELLSVGRRLLILMAAWGLFDAANVILAGALKGAGDTRFVMWYSVLLGWLVFVPSQWLIVIVMKCDIITAWAALAVYVALLSIGFLLRWRAGHWKDIEVIEPPPPAAPRPPGEDFVATEV